MRGLDGGEIYPDHFVDMSHLQHSFDHTFDAGQSQGTTGILQLAEAPDDGPHGGAVNKLHPGKVKDDAGLVLANDFLVHWLAQCGGFLI